MLVSQAINRVLRLLALIDVSQAAGASEVETVLAAMNSMVTRWEANGLALGWSNVSDLNVAMPSPDEADEAIIYNTALRIAPEFGIEMSPTNQALARQFLAELRRDQLVEMPLRVKSDLPYSETGGHYNMYTDTYH